jgi:hypothetical protein
MNSMGLLRGRFDQPSSIAIADTLSWGPTRGLRDDYVPLTYPR